MNTDQVKEIGEITDNVLPDIEMININAEEEFKDAY
jgi:hypothetical protein